MLSCKNKIVSSANWRWEMTVLEFNTIPWKIPVDLALIRNWFNISPARLNKRGDKGSPWRNPWDMLNSLKGDPFIKIDGLADERIAFIQKIHLSGNFIAKLIKLIWRKSLTSLGDLLLVLVWWKTNLALLARLHHSEKTCIIDMKFSLMKSHTFLMKASFNPSGPGALLELSFFIAFSISRRDIGAIIFFASASVSSPGERERADNLSQIILPFGLKSLSK